MADNPLDKYLPNPLDKYLPEPNPLDKHLPQNSPVKMIADALLNPVPAFGGKTIGQVIEPTAQQQAFQGNPIQSFATGLAGDIGNVATTPINYVPIPAGKILGSIPVAGTTVGRVASRVGIGKGFVESVRELGRLDQTLKAFEPLSARGGVSIPKFTPQPQPEQEMQGSIRLSKFPPDVQQVIKDSGVSKTAVRTFEQQRARAEELKGTIDIGSIQPQDILNAETRRAVGLQIIDKAKLAVKSGRKEELQSVYDDIVKLNGLHSEAGRLLGSLRDSLFDMDDEGVKTLYQGLERISPDDTGALKKFFKQATTPNWWDKFMEYRTSSLLSSPYTHERNFIGNTIGRLFKIPERVLSGGADAVQSFLKGTPRERYSTEAVADIVGSARGLRLGIRRAYEAMLNEDFSSSQRMTEAVRFGKSIPGPIGKIIRTPFRLLNASDEFFSTWAHTSDLYAQAYRSAVKEGASDLIGRTAELVKNPSFEMITNASEEALKQTFRTPLGDAGKAVQRAINKTPLAKLQIPFFRTPLNLYKWTFDRSPLSLIKLATPNFWKLSGGNLSDEIGKMAFGQITSAGLAYEVMQGNITGRLSGDKEKRDALMRQGIMPYSIKIGDKYISYRGYEPLASLTGLIANTIESVRESNKQLHPNQISAIVMESAKFAKDQPFLQGVSDILNALDDPQRYGERVIQNLTSSVVVPQGVSYVAKLQDPTVRDPETLPDAIKSRVPVLSKQVEPKLDVWGRPITKEGTLMQRALNPSGVVTYKPDMTEQELISLEKFPTKIVSKYRGMDLNIKERNDITRVEGLIAKKLLDKAISTTEYKNAGIEEQRKLVDKIISTVRTEVRKGMLSVDSEPFLKRWRDLTNDEERMMFLGEYLNKKVIKR